MNGPVSGHPSIISAFVWRIGVEVVHCVTINDILNILHTWTFELYILFCFCLSVRVLRQGCLSAMKFLWTMGTKQLSVQILLTVIVI